MPAVRAWLRRLRGTVRESPADAAMEDELALHLEMAEAELRRRGLAPAEARRQARLQAGGIAQAMERRRDQRGLPWLEDLLRDARFGVRTLRRSPAYTAVALATLALSIGATTAVFSILDVLVFRDLPVRDPGQLVQFTWQYPGDPPLNMFGIADYERYRDHNGAFSAMAGLMPFADDGRAIDDPLSGELVTGNLFELLGVRPAAGRLIEPHDDAAGAPLVAVVSWDYWKRRGNLSPSILGTTIVVRRMKGTPVDLQATIVGVAERDFRGLVAGYAPDVWVPASGVGRRAALALVARLAPGASIARARAEMRALDRDRIERFAERDPQWRRVALEVTSARAGLSTPLHDQFERPLLAVLAIVGALLLLACANVGGLLLARGAARRHEMAVRVSLGAGRFRLARQLLTESIVLAGAGGVLGLAAARIGAGLLMRIMTSGTRSLAPPPRIDLALDVRVWLFTGAITLLAALLFGLAPALAAFVSAPAPALRAGAGDGAPGRRFVGGALVAAQVAMSLALLTLTAASIAHLAHLRDRSLGFDRTGVLLVSADAERRGRAPGDPAARAKETLARLEAIPGVRSATLSGMTPISGAAGSRFIAVEGMPEPASARRRVSLNGVAPRYFETLRTPFVAGRDFSPADETGPRAVIVNQALVRRYLPGRDPLGARVLLEGDAQPYQIVGVVADAKYQDVRAPAPATLYLPYLRQSGMPAEFILRTSVPPASIAAEARRAVEDALGAPVRRITTLADQVDASIVPERLTAALAGFFGGVAALLAAIGLYGLLAYTVARRTREIGLRLALGATRGRVMRMVLGRAAWLVLAGFAAGAPAAYWATRIAARFIVSLPAGPLRPVAVAAAALAAVAIVAAYVPVRRAARIEPLTALRTE